MIVHTQRTLNNILEFLQNNNGLNIRILSHKKNVILTPKGADRKQACIYKLLLMVCDDGFYLSTTAGTVVRSEPCHVTRTRSMGPETRDFIGFYRHITAQPCSGTADIDPKHSNRHWCLRLDSDK